MNAKDYEMNNLLLEATNNFIDEQLSVIKEQHDEIEGLNKENERIRTELNGKESIIKEVREYITSYESISTIQGLEEIEANKDLDEKTLNEMVRRYMIVHDKVLEILDKEN